ncbi:MAG: nitrile hydratase accessory protein [Leptolyngbya sp. SIO1D8]|nr:nitrile hydratase accessory protein [Leptolyngbya sp. SIO1D8]
MSLSSPDSLSLSGLPEKDHEPAFQAPWEARAFAIVNQLATTQHYSWAEWTDQFVGEIAAAEAEPANASSYYERWVQACEKLLIAKGILDAQSIDQKIKALLIEQEQNEHQHRHASLDQ